MSLLRSFFTVSGWTAASRVLGLVRDVLMAKYLGPYNHVADAFFVAFRIPNMFRRIFGEGAFNAAFVPLLARRLEEEGQGAAHAFAEQALAAFVAALVAVTLVCMIAMPGLMYVLAPGFLADDDKFALTVELAVIAFPYLLFISLMAFFGGMLNALLRFKAAAAAPVLLNVFMIAALVAVVPFTDAPGPVLAWTVSAAGVGQFLVVAVALRRAGISLRLRRPRVTPAIKRLAALMVPGLLAAAVLQINLVVGTLIASFQDGAVSLLYFADRIYQLPLGLIGIAFGIVLLPELSRKLRAGEDDAAMGTMNRGIEFAMLLTLPAAVALIVIAHPIVIVLFERDAFTRIASDATAWALAAFALGLPAYVLVKVLQPGFFAREDTVTPLRFAAVSVAVNIAVSLALFFPLGHIGIALATAVAAWVNTILLFARLRRRGLLAIDSVLARRLPRIVVASLAMGAGLWVEMSALAPWFDGSTWVRIAGLTALIAGGLVLYAVAVLALGAASRAELSRHLRRPRGPTPLA